MKLDKQSIESLDFQGKQSLFYNLTRAAGYYPHNYEKLTEEQLKEILLSFIDSISEQELVRCQADLFAYLFKGFSADPIHQQPLFRFEDRRNNQKGQTR